jgi:hypothetical protein
VAGAVGMLRAVPQVVVIKRENRALSLLGIRLLGLCLHGVLLIERLGYWECYKGVAGSTSPVSYGQSRQHLASVACLRFVAKR